MITTSQAAEFAHHWISAWNSHDLDAIMEHYAEDLEFYSPMVAGLKFNDQGKITQKTELRSYFQIGLNAYPELHFELHSVFAGIHSVVIQYTSVKGRLASEVFELDAAEKVVRVLCHYAN